MDIWTTDLNPSTGGFNQPPGSYAYATIGPNSEIAAVNYGGSRLAVGSVVPARGFVEPVFRPGSANVCTRLQLQLWKCGEVPVPGPRAPYVRDILHTNIPLYPSFGVEHMRVPFQGRRHGTFFVEAPAGIATLRIRIYGITYMTTELGGQDVMVDLLTPNGTSGYTFTEAAAPTFDPVITGAGQLYLGYHIGGTDSAECGHDELSLFIASGGAPVTQCRVRFIAHPEDNV